MEKAVTHDGDCDDWRRTLGIPPSLSIASNRTIESDNRILTTC
uniref:Uncharacterized protein n=1 Tax=viral metagenome TaxID=1070528 RepID=A0A6C0J939_9ZZZZ